MIFTRRFGALRARQTFPSQHVIDVAEYETQRKADFEQRVAAKATRSRRRFWHGPAAHTQGQS